MQQHSEEPLGTFLRERREALGFSVRKVADELHTAQKFIIALEEGNYKQLTAKVYARSFLLRLILLLKLGEETASLLLRFEREWDVFSGYKKKDSPKPYSRTSELYITPARVRFGLIGIGLFLLVAFFGVRLFEFVRAPALVINEPKETQVKKSEPVLRISGKGEKESTLTVNGRMLRMDELGNFDGIIELLRGLNILEFTLENRFGKLTRATKYVLVE